MSKEAPSAYDLPRLRDGVRPLPLHHVPALPSTNDRAKQDVESALLDAPAVIVADTQSAGRGRGSNTWWSPPGNIAATFVMAQNPNVAPGLVPLLAGLALRRALVRVTGCEAILLKWPNDLLIGERKLAGLLCERLHQVDLIGVGVNVNAPTTDAPPGLRDRITSLREHTGRPCDLADLLIAISREMTTVLSTDSEDATAGLLRQYTSHHGPTGRAVTLIDTDPPSPITGRCLGIDPQGRLLLKTGEHTRACLTGTITSIAPEPDPP